MVLNYANLFMGNFEQNLLCDYSQKTGLSSLEWIGFIDDIFFIRNGNKDFWSILFPSHRIRVNPRT